MLRSEDDPIDIMFYFPVAFSQVYRSGDGSSGSGIVGDEGGGALGWAAKAGTTIPSSLLLVASPILCLPLLFSYSFQTPQSAFYYLSAIQVFSLIPPPYILGRRLFVQFFSLYNLLSNYHHLLLLYLFLSYVPF
jgi:hypothetical protein